MTKLFALLFLLASTPAFAASAWESSIAAATDAYRTDFLAERGSAAAEPVGYFFELEGEEVLTSVYFLDGGDLRAYVYGCHEHGPGEFDCHREDRADLGTYGRSSILYSAAEMQKSLPLALELFAAKVGPVESLRSIKLWEAEENIRFVMAYEPAGQAGQVFYQACHYHGAEMDCHRKRDAGPGEPGKN